jgi:hypothetical protein
MTDGHPSCEIDQGAAIETMTTSWIQGGYWDARAARVRPELAEVDIENRWRLIDDLAEDDPAIAAMSERQEYDAPLGPELSKVVREWMVRRAAYAMRVLSEIPVVEGHVVATRAVMCRPEDLRSPLGVHWSWDTAWCGGADAHWAPKDGEDLPVIHLVASVPVSSVDWQTTLLCAMDYLCGDDERELRLRDGAPVSLTSVSIGETPVPMRDGLRQIA